MTTFKSYIEECLTKFPVWGHLAGTCAIPHYQLLLCDALLPGARRVLSHILLSQQSFSSINKYALQFNILEEAWVKDVFIFQRWRLEIAQFFRSLEFWPRVACFLQTALNTDSSYQYVTSLRILAENWEHYILVIWFSHYRALDQFGCRWVMSLTLNKVQLDWRIWWQNWTVLPFCPPHQLPTLAGSVTQTTENTANALYIIKLISLNKKIMACFLLCLNKYNNAFCLSLKLFIHLKVTENLDFTGLI